MPTITLFDEQTDLPLSHDSVRKAACFLLDEHFSIPCQEWIVHFVTAPRISELHAEFFDDPSVTDCITFPIDAGDEDPEILGEVFLCPAFALTYCKENQGDPYEELSLYLIHTLLHLLGHDDQDPSKEPLMREEERVALDALKNEGLLLHS